MAGTVKGPAIFLAQFAGDAAPFNSFDGMCNWAASLGYKGVQIPTWDDRLFDLAKAGVLEDLLRRDRRESRRATASRSPSLRPICIGQLVAVNPAYDDAFDAFAPKEVHGKPAERQKWAVEQMMKAAKASKRLGLTAHPTFSGALAWPYPLSLAAARAGPDRDRVRGTRRSAGSRSSTPSTTPASTSPTSSIPARTCSTERPSSASSTRSKGHKRCAINYDPSHFVLQQLDYLDFIDIYHERIKAFHVKDAEFNPTGRQGVYSGYAPWIERAGRFRSLGDGQVDFGGVFSKLAQYGYSSWAVLEWECCLKHPEDGAREGAEFIKHHIIRVTEKAFDDFAGGAIDKKQIKRALGLK